MTYLETLSGAKFTKTYDYYVDVTDTMPGLGNLVRMPRRAWILFGFMTNKAYKDFLRLLCFSLTPFSLSY